MTRPRPADIDARATSEQILAAAPAEARAFLGGLTDLMNALLAIAEQETELVRRGRLGEASRLGEEKSALAGRYMAEMVRLKSHAPAWFAGRPALREALRERHELFRALLQVNLTVLATAHAVSEGLVRGATGEAARKAAPQTYGASGRATLPSPKAVGPVAVSKSL